MNIFPSVPPSFRVNDYLRDLPTVTVHGKERCFLNNVGFGVDGISHRFEKVWIAPTMHGRYYGSGMMAAPQQDRLDPDKKLSIIVLHGERQSFCMRS